MALSNIFREPRREITESAVGIAVSLVPIAFYGFLIWATAQALGPTSTGDMVAAYVIAVCLAIGGTVITAAFISATHAIGDGICNALERLGVHLRPRERH